MSFQNVFNRYELKYFISKTQQQQIKNRMCRYMDCDAYGKSTICNIYFDTPGFLLARRGLEKPAYKEKLRLRSYGVAGADSTVFLELKKKYKSVVYKRRTDMNEAEAWACLRGGEPLPDTQICREVDYFRGLYAPLGPAVFLSYDRAAFFAKDDPDFRVTFDENILWRDWDLSLRAGVYGEAVLSGGGVLMEIKTSAALPLWMAEILSQGQIYKTSFSKYGSAYRALSENKIGGRNYA